MRLVPTSVLLIVLSTLVSAQTEKLPDILKPDAESEAYAQRMGAKVFKLLPYKMFNKWPPPESTKDEDQPLGIRGGGANYSFSTGFYSFNKNPEIRLEDKQLVSAGVPEITFFADLGKRDLSTIDSKSAEADYFLAYKVPKYWKDFPAERLKFSKGVMGGLLTLSSEVFFSSGNSYLLRAIRVEKTDITVVLQILRIDPDGSLTIAWKKLAEVPSPMILYMPDEELQAKVDAIIAEEHLVCDRVVVKDNHLYFLVPPKDRGKKDDSLLEHLLKDRGIRYRGSGGELH